MVWAHFVYIHDYELEEYFILLIPPLLWYAQQLEQEIKIKYILCLRLDRMLNLPLN